MLRASEKTEADALALAAQTHLAEATAAAEAARSATPIELPPLQAEHFVFQNTGREIGVVWGHRTRYGVEGARRIARPCISVCTPPTDKALLVGL
jgi:hypothetical protein